MNEVSFLFLRNPGYDAEINFLQFPLFDHTVKDPFAFFIFSNYHEPARIKVNTVNHVRGRLSFVRQIFIHLINKRPRCFSCTVHAEESCFFIGNQYVLIFIHNREIAPFFFRKDIGNHPVSFTEPIRSVFLFPVYFQLFHMDRFHHHTMGPVLHFFHETVKAFPRMTPLYSEFLHANSPPEEITSTL